MHATSHLAKQNRVVSLAGLTLLVALVGCGGGSSSVPPPTQTRSAVTGTITDLDGSAIVNADVTMQGYTPVKSSQFGTYSIADVTLPTGANSQVFTVFASATVNGRSWSGQNTFEIIKGDTRTPDIHVVLSDTALQGSISGMVRDAQGRAISSALVVAAAGPYQTNDTPPSNYFSNIKAFTAMTDGNGSYTIPRLPPLNKYTLTASFAGQRNQTINNVSVTTNNATAVSFTLNAGSGASTVPPAQNLTATSITTPVQPTRAAGGYSQELGLNAIKQWLWAKRGLLKHRAASLGKVTLNRSVSRAVAGSVIENTLFWDYDPTLDNVFGYEIYRSADTNTRYNLVATIRDPLADRFADADSTLNPDVSYYYTVLRLDTINFPNGIDQNPLPFSDFEPVTRPLGPITQTAPASGATVSATPTFTWTKANRAVKYTALVYDRFPTLQSDTDTNGVQPLWTSVSLNSDNITYNGPTLASGQTYWWAVLAADDVNSAYTITTLTSFKVQ